MVFLVPTGRGQATDLISAEEFEQVFEKLHSTSYVFCLTSRAPKRSTAGDFCGSEGRRVAARNSIPDHAYFVS